MGFLDNLDLLSDLTKEEKEQLSLFSQEKVLKKGETLFKEGDEGVAMYFLLSGKIEISKNINLEKVILGEVEAEQVLGEMALFGENKERMATAVAIENCELITILYFSINQLTKKYPKLLEKIKNIIEKREKDNEDLLEQVS